MPVAAISGLVQDRIAGFWAGDGDSFRSVSIETYRDPSARAGRGLINRSAGIIRYIGMGALKIECQPAESDWESRRFLRV